MGLLEAPRSSANEERLDWTSGQAEIAPEVLTGTEAFDVALYEEKDSFLAFGLASTYARTEDGGDTWPEAGTGVGSLGFNVLGGTVTNRFRVVVGTGGDVRYWSRDPAAPSTDWETPTDPPATGEDLMDVARYGRTGFVAVGRELTIVETTDGLTNLAGDPDSWVDVDTEALSVPDCDEVPPDLYGVARVGDAVVAVGECGTVLVKRFAHDWEQVDLTADDWCDNEGFAADCSDVTFRGVTSDGTLEFFDLTGLEPTTHQFTRHGAFIAVGDDGLAVRMEMELDRDFGVPPAAQADFLLDEPELADFSGAQLPEDFDLYDVISDERSRVLVGTDRDGVNPKALALTIPHEEDISDPQRWEDRSPTVLPGSNMTNTEFFGIASDGLHYVAVGRKGSDGLVYPATEAVYECTVYVDRTTTDLGANYEIEVEIDLTDTDPDGGDPGHITCVGAGSPFAGIPTGDLLDLSGTGIAKVWPVFDEKDPSFARVPTPGEATLSGDVLTATIIVEGVDPDPDYPMPFLRTNLVTSDAGLIENWRITFLPEFGNPLYSDVLSSGRTINHPKLVPDSATFDIEADLPSPVELVDILTGLIDTPGDSTDPVQVSAPFTQVGTQPQCAAHLTAHVAEVDEEDITGGDGDREVGFDRFFDAVSRFRGKAGHGFVDGYDGFEEGWEWKYYSMKHYFRGRCSAELSCMPEDTDVECEWVEELCCQEGEGIGEDDFVARPTIVPLFVPFDGQARLGVEFSQDAELSPDRLCEFNNELDPEDTDIPPDDRPAFPPSENVFIVNDARNVIIVLDHVDACFSDVDYTDGSVEVNQGEVIALASIHRVFDIVVFVNDEGDRWRKISYFDLITEDPVDADQYDYYENNFGFSDRDPATHDVCDPIIPRDLRDDCPVMPMGKEPGGGVVKRVGVAEVFGCADPEAQELASDNASADFPGPMLAMFPEPGAAMCPQDWCAHLPDEINLDTPCSP